MENLYALGCALLVVVVVALLVYVFVLSDDLRQSDEIMATWVDAYSALLRGHESMRDGYEALKQSHRELQADYLVQGRALVIAEAKAHAADRMAS